MKLLYITNGINGSGGLERVLSIKASSLADNYNYQVTILSLNNGNENPFYNFSKKIIMLNIALGGNPIQYIKSYIKGIQKAVTEINPDAISVCDDGLKGFFIPKILGKKIPIIYERHASIKLNTSSTFKGRLLEFMMKKLSSDFSRFVVLTKSAFSEWGNTSNIIVISNPLAFFPTNSSTLLNKNVIAVGSYSYNKGYDLLLEAWQIIVKQCPDWRLSIYGKKDSAGFYQNLAEKLDIIDTVAFFEPVNYINQEYLKSSLMAMSSRSEGFGMVLIEAMACGLPCVSFDCPSGPRDIITHGIDGYLVREEDVSELASCLITLMENYEKRKKMGEKAKENVKKFMPQIILKQWDDLFKQLIYKTEL